MKGTSSTRPSSAHRSPARVAARWALVVLIGLGGALMIDLARQALASEKVRWATLPPENAWTAHIDPVAAPAEGVSADRPRLIRFTADWCPPCLSMKARVFSKDSVANAVHERFEAYSIDLTDPDANAEALGLRYQIVYLPTLLITDATGNELARLDRDVDEAGFLRWLDQGWERWVAHESSSDAIASPISHIESIN